ncbi:helix-turn-helix domain-containing protein [bacterium]|nr:helix-turn-helix domain-containing protein [bacterium]
MGTKFSIDESEVSEKFSIPKQTLRNWRCSRKHLEYYKIGRKIYYNESEVVSFFEQRRVKMDV